MRERPNGQKKLVSERPKTKLAESQFLKRSQWAKKTRERTTDNKISPKSIFKKKSMGKKKLVSELPKTKLAESQFLKRSHSIKMK